ncbi:hypothetical protein SAMN05720354_10844 [Nitrosospira sp. Nsp1]|nr:hypothetical protein SAMN05720354_10844 [Nitrosospira sp. Nsp1]
MRDNSLRDLLLQKQCDIDPPDFDTDQADYSQAGLITLSRTRIALSCRLSCIL